MSNILDEKRYNELMLNHFFGEVFRKELPYNDINFEYLDTSDKNSQPIKMENKRIPKNWGHELIIHNTSYCMKYLYVEKDRMCSIHFHHLKDEIFHLIKGVIKVELWFPQDFDYYEVMADAVKKDYFVKNPARVVVMSQGSTLRINPLVAHRFTGIDDENIIIECSTNDLHHDSKRIVNSPEKR